MKKSKENKIYVILLCIFVALMLMPFINVISPMQFSDGIPMLERVYRFETGNESLGKFIFYRHGNSLHTIVYFTAMLDSFFNNNMPYIMETLELLGLALTVLIFALVLTKEIWKNDKMTEMEKMIRSLVFSIFVALLIIGCTQLLLPFQISLSSTRPLFMIGVWLLVWTFHSGGGNARYFLCVLYACIVAPLHGMGIMFAGTFVFLHIIYKKGILRTAISFLPAIVTFVIQFLYNDGFGEISSGESNYLIDNFGSFIKSMVAFFGSPLSALGIHRRILIVISIIMFVVVFYKVIVSAFVGLGLNRLRILPEKIQKVTMNYPMEEGFMLGVLGMAFLASVSSAMFVAARISYYPTIAADPVGYVLGSTRYACFAVIPYIYVLWKLACCFTEDIRKKMGAIVANGVVFLVVVVNFCHVWSETKSLNEGLDFAAVAILSDVDITTSVPSTIFPGFTEDAYWKDAIPISMNYFKYKNEYLWYGQPDIGISMNLAVLKTDLTNISILEYEEDPRYSTFTASVSKIPDKRYIPIMDCNNTVIGFAYVVDVPGFYRAEGKIYYKNTYEIRGFMLSSATASEYFTVLLE